jgi:hypothetical protein
MRCGRIALSGDDNYYREVLTATGKMSNGSVSEKRDSIALRTPIAAR